MLEAASVGLGRWSDEPGKAVQGKTGKLPIVGGAARPTAKRAARRRHRGGARGHGVPATMPWAEKRFLRASMGFALL
jgi:hypothetical protein